jgi:hypothetical protein
MWEEEPVGVDPKRPLVGFALVAVLCAVLMTLSVGRGWGGELFHPGKPIANVAAGGHLDRVPSPAPQQVEPVEVNIPAELSTQPLCVAVGSPVVKKAVSEPAQDATKDTKATNRAADKAERRADKAERKADRAASKAAKAADKAAAKAERSAAKAERDFERLAAKLARTGLKALEKAARQG